MVEPEDLRLIINTIQELLVLTSSRWLVLAQRFLICKRKMECFNAQLDRYVTRGCVLLHGML
jgi:hypothetical protein